jgi:hypothetical protein
METKHNLRNHLRCMIVSKDGDDTNLAGVPITGLFASQSSNRDGQMVMVELSTTIRDYDQLTCNAIWLQIFEGMNCVMYKTAYPSNSVISTERCTIYLYD